MKISNFLNNVTKSQSSRSTLFKKNLILLFVFRSLGVLISFLLVPITINYVNAETYGIWLTISSMVAWISLFDVGINNGLRNKLSETLATKDYDAARRYVSTTYVLLSCIFIPLFILFILINNYINWSDILNCSPNLADELTKVMFIVFGYFCFKFILSTINVIFLAEQKPSVAALIGLSEQVVSLGIIYTLTKFSSGSLLNLSIGLCIAPLFLILFINLFLFSKYFYAYRPNIRLFGRDIAKNIFGLGIKFFIIQIAGIIQFQTSNFIIIQMFGPKDVTIFNIAFKYFSIITLSMSIIITPLWSAVTNAYFNKDYEWIIRSVKKYQFIAFLLFLLGCILLIFSNSLYNFWLGPSNLKIPFEVSLWMLIFSFLSALGSIYVMVLNGISALRIQFISALISPFIFVISCFILVEYFNMGISAIIISSIIGNYNGIILAPLQYYKIFIKKNLHPIWRSS